MVKKVLYWILVFVLSFMLAACSGGPAGGPDTQDVEPTAPVADSPLVDEDTAEPETDSDGAAEQTQDMSGPQLASQLSVYNWSDYIDEQVLADYEEEYGVEIVYDTFASNEDLLAKLQAGATGYDVIFPSDYMVSQLIDLGLLAEIDVNQLPNWDNISETFHNPPFDPGNQHCVPYQWGTTGLAYRAGHGLFEENPPTSWSYLFEPEMLEQYSEGGINVLNDQRELIGAALAYLGYSMNTQERSELEEARDLLLEAKPYWKTFNSEDYDDSLLVADEVVLSHSWSGDAAAAYWNTYDDDAEDGNWYYAIPEEGAVRWVDNICVTAASERTDTALHFINYLLEGEVGATITNFTYYASPNEAAREFILEEILNDAGIYPPPEVEANLEWLEDVGDAIFIYDEVWTAVKG